MKQAKPPPVALGKQYVIKYNLLTVFARNTVSKEVGLRVSNVWRARQHKTTTDRQDWQSAARLQQYIESECMQ